MLKAGLKKEVLQILEALTQLHHMGLRGHSYEDMCNVLQDCQSAAIELGEKIEQSVENSQLLVKKLELYCECLFQLSQNYPIEAQDISALDQLLKEEKNLIESRQVKYLVVFFPYKASMWDSLESVWLACKDDCRCECKVVPIPYYKFDNTKQAEAKYCYEGLDFPDYVPVIDYHDFSLEKECPDIAYIHNPYDQFNFITSIHPDYYSYNLKKYVSKLVYIPYYVKAGNVSENQKYLSVYTSMDYMIAQSEQFKDGFSGLPYYDKLIPLGSPKFDRIIHMNRNKKIPDEWKNMIAGKKTVMLNTSINCFLSHGEVMLKKLKVVFDCIKNQNDVVLIWRPHPLIEATIESMRPQLKAGYLELLEYFHENLIGIFDKTPDITNTVAISDAYIGEAASSVVHLFGAVGKPIFILDDFVTENFEEKSQRRIMIADMLESAGVKWILPLQYDGLFILKKNNWHRIEFVKHISDDLNFTCTNINIKAVNNKLYFSPYDERYVCSYDPGSNVLSRISRKADKSINAKKVVTYQEKIFYLLTYENAIGEFNTKTNCWRWHKDVYTNLNKASDNNTTALMWDAEVQKNILWITSINSNGVLKFNMDNGAYDIYDNLISDDTFSGITSDEEHIYLAGTKSGNIVCMNTDTGENKILMMLQNLDTQVKTDSVVMVHTKILSIGEWIVTIPFYSSSMVKIHKITGESSLLIPEFWKNGMKIVNGYNPNGRGLAFFAKKISDTELLVQRLSDCALARIDVETGAYTTCYPEMAEESFEEFMKGQDGFERLSVDDGFACRESALFSFKEFLHKLAGGELETIKDRQMKSLSAMAANLDGTCGQKVHDYMMDVLGQELQ